MTKKSAIQKLSRTYERFDLGVNNVATGKNDPNYFNVQATVQILEKGEDGKPMVARRVSAYGEGATLVQAQENAIVTVIQNLGL